MRRFLSQETFTLDFLRNRTGVASQSDRHSVEFRVLRLFRGFSCRTCRSRTMSDALLSPPHQYECGEKNNNRYDAGGDTHDGSVGYYHWSSWFTYCIPDGSETHYFSSILIDVKAFAQLTTCFPNNRHFRSPRPLDQRCISRRPLCVGSRSP